MTFNIPEPTLETTWDTQEAVAVIRDRIRARVAFTQPGVLETCYRCGCLCRPDERCPACPILTKRSPRR